MTPARQMCIITMKIMIAAVMMKRKQNRQHLNLISAPRNVKEKG
ncbi:MAG: hypothetical protein IEMM0006_1070 [bacterium]|nr:MAG: hypothetical protein IEMM0006_1070 [bacterium]